MAMTLEQANMIVGAAFAEGRSRNLKPLSVAVLDAGGHLIAFQKQDGSSMLRFEIAFGKAYGALALGMGSRALFQRAQVETQLNAMFQPVVQLKSGGYIIINQTEALVAIDVNSGRATRERNVEATALKTNMEAAEEVANTLRKALQFVDAENLYPSTNCGMAPLPRALARGKLAALTAGAAIVRSELGG